MKVHENIKKYLNEKGIKQTYLSRKTGINIKSISFSLNGKRKLEIEEFRKICIALDVSSEVFIGGTK